MSPRRAKCSTSGTMAVICQKKPGTFGRTKGLTDATLKYSARPETATWSLTKYSWTNTSNGKRFWLAIDWSTNVFVFILKLSFGLREGVLAGCYDIIITYLSQYVHTYFQYAAAVLTTLAIRCTLQASPRSTIRKSEKFDKGR